MKKKKGNPTVAVLHVILGIAATNDELIEQMRLMKCVREKGFYKHVVCTIRGFGADQRKLQDIPEIRAFCRRLTALGFISYLDYSTTLDPKPLPPEVRYGWGAAEVWTCGERLAPGGLITVTPELLGRIESAVLTSNRVADERMGPFKEPTR